MGLLDVVSMSAALLLKDTGSIYIMDILSAFLTYVVPFLVTLTVVVFVHEMGHFLVARWNGVQVEVFSIGFGPEILGFNDTRGTRWKVSLVPLGGYVRFLGDTDSSSSTAAEVAPEMRDHAFASKRVWQRSAIVFAGPAANFLFAIVVFALVFMTIGRPFTPAVVDSVSEGGAAAVAGILPGDEITAVEGRTVRQFEDLRMLVPVYGAVPMRVTVLRDGSELVFQTVPEFRDMPDGFGKTQKIPVLGVSSSGAAFRVERLGPLEAVAESVGRTWSVSVSTLVAFGQIITGARGTDDLGGPIRIAEYSGNAAQLGFLNMIMFVAILSVNLGLINLFPVPVLDGGHLVLYAWEAVRGRPASGKVQDVGLRVGLILLFGLMIFTTWNDILRLIAG